MGMPLTGASGLRRQLGELSLEYFARAYFPEYFTKPVGAFHRKAYLELTHLLAQPPAHLRRAEAWPRSFAKSTIFNFFTPLNAALYFKRAFTVMASDTESQAQGFLRDIRNACESNIFLLEDFGETKGDVWRADYIGIRTHRGIAYIAAAGAESSVRGIRKAQYRPQLITLDDLEDDASVLTQDRVDKRYSWLTRALMPLGDETTDIIYVGTVLAYDSVFDRILRDPLWDSTKYSAIVQHSTSPLWGEWQRLRTDLSKEKKSRLFLADAFYEKNAEEMNKDAVVLWPEGRSYKALMDMRIEIGEMSFMAEYQNDPINPAECAFSREQFKYYDDEHLMRYKIRFKEYVAAIDPALGKNRLGDYTAIITLAKGDDGFIYVVDAFIEHVPVDNIIDVILNLNKKYHYTRFGVEVNLFQELLKNNLVKEAARRNVYLPIQEIRQTKDKVLRIQSLAPYISNGYLRFRGDQRLLLEQLWGFPKVKHDDGPDALEMAVRMLSHGPGMEAGECGVDNSYRKELLLYEEDEDNAQFGRSWMDF